jgi:hypothetical protein
MKPNPARRAPLRAAASAALCAALALVAPRLADAAKADTASEGKIEPHAGQAATPRAKPRTDILPNIQTIPAVDLQQTSLGPAFAGADVRELARRLKASGLLVGAPSGSVVRDLLARRRERALLLAAGVPQTAFVLPLDRGVLYDRDRRRLSLDADVSSGGEDRIVLTKHVEGKSGYKLTVAGEAESRGFVQTIDIADLDVAHHRGKRTLALSMTMDRDTFRRVENSLAVALVGLPTSPYLREMDTREEPSDDDPTLRLIHRTTVYFRLESAWLFDQRTGEVLSKGVKLAN